jgi:glucose/arabinose dehydrogenase
MEVKLKQHRFPLFPLLRLRVILVAASCVTWAIVYSPRSHVQAQSGPSLEDSNLAVKTAVSGLTQPTSMAFIGPNQFFVLEKASGQVKLVSNGAVTKTVLDLAVNNSSERGLLGIALDPKFPVNPGVYLYWTCQVPPPAPSDPFHPTALECPDSPVPGASGTDSSDILAVPLRGNRVDRFNWDAAAQTLTWDHNLIKLHAFQNDGGPEPPNQGDLGQPARGNHNGGIIRFGGDGKLYIIIGDNGRRGQLQNLLFGPTGPGVPDDQFGGPEPDANHLTGVILRLNEDGSAPSDNPFFANPNPLLRKVFAYGVRNSFGMAFDPYSGNLWTQENGDDSFDEINRVESGMDGGWIQIIGPVSRIAQFKQIETTMFGSNLQQLRWSPSNIADSAQEALSRLVLLPGAHYKDPEFSWKYAVAPAGIGFVLGRALGPQYEGDLIVGAATPNLAGGYLFRFNLTGNRQKIGVDDPRLEDRVADNTAKFDPTESESLMFGRDFGITTDVQTGPNGNLFVVSLSKGSVFEIYRNK